MNRHYLDVRRTGEVMCSIMGYAVNEARNAKKVKTKLSVHPTFTFIHTLASGKVGFALPQGWQWHRTCANDPTHTPKCHSRFNSSVINTIMNDCKTLVFSRRFFTSLLNPSIIPPSTFLPLRHPFCLFLPPLPIP